MFGWYINLICLVGGRSIAYIDINVGHMQLIFAETSDINKYLLDASHVMQQKLSSPVITFLLLRKTSSFLYVPMVQQKQFTRNSKVLATNKVFPSSVPLTNREFQYISIWNSRNRQTFAAFFGFLYGKHRTKCLLG